MERFYIERDYQGAIDELHQQVVSNPSDMAALGSYATLLGTISKYELAISLRRRAVELSPLFALSHSLASR